MSYVVVTRLSVARARDVPAFLAATTRIAWQARRAPGFRGGWLRADARGGYWTLTTWESARDMRAFTTSGAHRAAAPRLAAWADDAITAGWQQPGEEPPALREACLRAHATPSSIAVDHPAERPTPLPTRLGATLPLRPTRGARRRSSPGVEEPQHA